MFNLSPTSGPKPKCILTTTKLPNFLDHEQPPTKKRPFSTLLTQNFTHTFNLLLPSSAAETLQSHLSSSPSFNGKSTYSLLHLPPLALLTNPFFTTYIKSGNILMHSSGRPGMDSPILSLSNGVLRIEVDKPTFERLGLEGKSMPTFGRKHVKARFAIELDLRLPSMMRGKKGFDRVVWAFGNVLTETLTWVFCDLAGGEGEGKAVIEEHAPVVKEVKAEVLDVGRALVPVFPTRVKEQEYAEAAEVLEWLSLGMLRSPRILKEDDVDVFLSRYRVPNDAGEPREQDLVRLQWRGLIPPTFAHKILLAATKAAGQQWVAVNGQAFGGEAYMILINEGHSTTWEYKD
ncbi:ribonuclease p protein subunit [Zymoseptoria brevis]|uniref:Ribonuclease p protein subunit n=1 Tax=Zymoseptoria brevis TaxID=1047168 RepID=A0A0F4GIW5_9PEZI|nr:ribonuclease p protein subunit [Zymoseptoria brevis]